MKKISFLFKIGLLMTIFLVGAYPVQARAEKTDFSGISYMTGPPIDPGEETYPDGNVHMRGLILPAFDDMDDPRMTGVDIIVINYNMRTAPAPAFFTGPMWGTFVVENENGWWDGTWTGERNEQGFAIIRGFAHGHGDYEGLKAHYEIIRESPDPMAPSTVTGYIIDPHGE